MADFEVENCRTCHAQVIWAVTVNARAMPVDAEPAPGGNVQLEARPGLQPLARVLPVAKQFGKKDLHTSHFARCPQAERWRSGRRSGHG